MRRGILTLFVLVACRSEPSVVERQSGASGSAAVAPAPSASILGRPSIEAITGWWIVDSGAGEGAGAGGANVEGPRRRGTGWWLSRDAVRIVWKEGADRTPVTTVAPAGDLLRIDLDGGRSLLLSKTTRGLLVRMGEATITLRRADDGELRALEKLDAQQGALAGACARASACCAAAVGKGLATNEDCAAIGAAPELGRCVRAFELLAKKAKTAGATIAECAP
jgi:hypothetical protein